MSVSVTLLAGQTYTTLVVFDWIVVDYLVNNPEPMSQKQKPEMYIGILTKFPSPTFP